MVRCPFSAEFMVMKSMVLRLYDNLSLKKLINLKRNHHLYTVINMFGFLNKVENS
jgi:hypothetical protein